MNPALCTWMKTVKQGIGGQEKELNARRAIHERFNPNHLKVMDDQMKQFVGLV